MCGSLVRSQMGSSHKSPSSSLAQDTALSRRRRGFKSPWGRYCFYEGAFAPSSYPFLYARSVPLLALLPYDFKTPTGLIWKQIFLARCSQEIIFPSSDNTKHESFSQKHALLAQANRVVTNIGVYAEIYFERPPVLVKGDREKTTEPFKRALRPTCR